MWFLVGLGSLELGYQKFVNRWSGIEAAMATP